MNRQPWYQRKKAFSTSLMRKVITVEPPNKGYFGKNINSVVMSFVERLSSSWRFKKHIRTTGKPIIWDIEKCPCREVCYIMSYLVR